MRGRSRRFGIPTRYFRRLPAPRPTRGGPRRRPHTPRSFGHSPRTGSSSSTTGTSLSDQGCRDLLEVLDDRYVRRGTTFEDAIVARVLKDAHRIALEGESMRRLYDSAPNTPPPVSLWTFAPPR